MNTWTLKKKHLSLVETNLPSPMTARVYVNLPEGNIYYDGISMYSNGTFNDHVLDRWGDETKHRDVYQQEGCTWYIGWEKS